MNESLRKQLTIASAVAVLAAWLNEQFQLFSEKVTDWLRFGATVTQLVLAIA